MKEKERRNAYQQQEIWLRAEKVLSGTRFDELSKRFRQEKAENHVSLAHVRWNSNGYSDTAKVTGRPNSVGIVLEWDRHESMVEINEVWHNQTSFYTILIVANSHGEIRVQGADSVTKQYWDQETQLDVFNKAIKNPSKITLKRKIQTKNGIRRL